MKKFIWLCGFLICILFSYPLYADFSAPVIIADLTAIQAACSNDFHNIGGTDNELTEAEVEGHIFDDDNTGSLLTSGTLAGRLPFGSEISSNTALNTSDLYGKMYVVTAACTVTLDKVTDINNGATVCLYVRDAAETVIVEVDDADKINLHGTPLDAGDTIDSPGNAGDYICLVSYSDVDGSGTDGWFTMGYGKATWTDGGAS